MPVDEHAFGMREPSGRHALGKCLGSLAREAGERVLGEVAWHRNSRKQLWRPSIS